MRSRNPTGPFMAAASSMLMNTISSRCSSRASSISATAVSSAPTRATYSGSARAATDAPRAATSVSLYSASCR